MSAITKEFTKEQLIAKAQEQIKLTKGLHLTLSAKEHIDMCTALFEIALASLEAEPVCVIDQSNIDYLKSGSDADVWPASRTEMGDVLLYRDATPAPVVPDMKELVAILDWILMLPCPTPKATLMAKRLAVVIDACRAAMLQGAEPVTTAYKLPFEQWLSQQTGTIDVECGCVMTEVFFHWLRVAYEAGNSPQCREISNSSTKHFRENAQTSTKCWCRTCRPVTFADSHFVVCPECGNKRCPHANDHRHACTGSNEPGQEGSAYPAAPQQEVK